MAFQSNAFQGNAFQQAQPPPTPTIEQPHLLVKLQEFILDDHDREGEDMLILALMETLLND